MDELSLLRSRIDDVLTEAYEKGNGYLGFLNEAEVSYTKGYLKNQGVNFHFYGGYSLASRCFLCISPFDSEIDVKLYPFKPYIIKARSCAEISHRDYLGSLMSLGIKRDCIGDILTISTSSAIVFIRDEIAGYVIESLRTIGREGVSVSVYTDDIRACEPKSEDIKIIVSSMRLDNVVSACINKSRTNATLLIDSELVYVNYVAVSKASHTVREGDVMSIRGYGKFKIMEQVSITRKDRLVIRVLHYI